MVTGAVSRSRVAGGVMITIPSSAEVKNKWNYAYFLRITLKMRRTQWLRRLSRSSAAARPLNLWVRIPPGAWMSVCCGCCVLSLPRADHSSRGVLPTVVRSCV
jgi:hypothetical protein